jgi:DNA-binding CsgD family transcriptional regulator
MRITEPELLVLRGFADGKTYTQLGHDLGLSINQVKSIASSLYRKLGVRHMSHAVAEGFRHGLLYGEQTRVERDWLLAEASDPVRERFFRARDEERSRRSGGSDSSI